ncbi:NAD(P)-dependent oxidoreductase [Rathayibacter sp. CAU 1779]
MGFSRVGRRVVRLVQGLESVRCLVADPYADADEVASAGATLVPLDQLLRESQTVSIHAPELPETRNLIGSRELALMPDHATLINTARGSLVDTTALERECSSGRLNAMLDVTFPEPLPSTSVLYDLPNVMLTPHIAGSLGSETLRMTDSMLDDLARYLTGMNPMHTVTRDALAISA